MIIEEYNYSDHKIEIHEHPIYHDFEFVVKNNDGKVVYASKNPYENLSEAKEFAEIKINLKNNDNN